MSRKEDVCLLAGGPRELHAAESTHHTRKADGYKYTEWRLVDQGHGEELLSWRGEPYGRYGKAAVWETW